RHYRWISSFSEQDRAEVFEPGILKEFRGVGKEYIYNVYPQSTDLLNCALYADVKNILPFDMLTKVDWMSMLNSLEVRSPLLDYRIAELAFRIPSRYKVQPFKLKAILKHALKLMLPPSL